MKKENKIEIRDDFGLKTGEAIDMGIHPYLELKDIYNNFDTVKIVYDSATDQEYTLLSDAHLDELVVDIENNPLNVTRETYTAEGQGSPTDVFKFTDEDGCFFTVRVASEDEEVVEAEFEVVE